MVVAGRKTYTVCLHVSCLKNCWVCSSLISTLDVLEIPPLNPSASAAKKSVCMCSSHTAAEEAPPTCGGERSFGDPAGGGLFLKERLHHSLACASNWTVRRGLLALCSQSGGLALPRYCGWEGPGGCG